MFLTSVVTIFSIGWVRSSLDRASSLEWNPPANKRKINFMFMLLILLEEIYSNSSIHYYDKGMKKEKTIPHIVISPVFVTLYYLAWTMLVKSHYRITTL